MSESVYALATSDLSSEENRINLLPPQDGVPFEERTRWPALDPTEDCGSISLQVRDHMAQSQAGGSNG